MIRIVGDAGPLGTEGRRRGRPTDPYGALVRTIAGQQLSTKAARAIYVRLESLFEGRAPAPEEILAADEGALRAAGLSRPKISYLKDLAWRVTAGDLDLDALEVLPDDEVVDKITSVKGLGRWSADMFLIFHLERPDVLPVGDLGIRRAVERAYGLPSLPDPETIHGIAAPWRPHRTLASLYLWGSLDNLPATG